ncbi:hypothetical protein IV203_003672 [Nitzschia inconspicua]|uniref:Uncharacterized protein n=1 Tax=Nitzschia inconspicua TaxID=303405 RepID=A0A9K3L3X5_9STRA|nr:hypothetical protein IV203_003672 [Nitzschia inconspicua]
MPFPSREPLFVSLAALLFFHSNILFVHGETVILAACPKEPEVVGKFYNDGKQCVRDRSVITRTVEDVMCPSGYAYKANYCRKRFHTKVKPECPTGFQYYGGKRGECHSPCPPGYSRNYGECVLTRQTLTSNYMTCEERDAEGHIQHRYGAFCCSHELGNCPKAECNVEQAPGKFYYENGLCQRQAQSLPRKTSPQLKLRLGQDAPPGQRPRKCPEGLVAVRNVCQEPCPEGFRPNKGSCQLFSCTFDTRVDKEVRCPEGIYKVANSMV